MFDNPLKKARRLKQRRERRRIAARILDRLLEPKAGYVLISNAELNDIMSLMNDRAYDNALIRAKKALLVSAKRRQLRSRQPSSR